MKKTISVLLCLTLLLSAFSGCRGKEAEKPTSPIWGRWTMEVDLSGAVADVMAQKTGSRPEVEGVVVLLSWEFRENGTYRCRLDRASAEAGICQIAAGRLLGLGIDVELNTFLSMSGAELKDLLDGLEMERIIDEAMAFANADGRYKLENGRLWLNRDRESDQFPQEEASPYTLEEGNILLDYGTLKPLQ